MWPFHDPCVRVHRASTLQRLCSNGNGQEQGFCSGIVQGRTHTFAPDVSQGLRSSRSSHTFPSPFQAPGTIIAVGMAMVAWGPTFLEDFAGRCLQHLACHDPQGRARLSELLSASGTTWATGCSGTDSPNWCFTAMQKALQKDDGSEVRFHHLASGEHDRKKQRFLRAVSSPRRLVSDVFDLSAPSALDVLSGERFKLVEELLACDQFLAGFVCKTVSCLNPHKDVARRAIGDTSTATGGTLWAMVLFAERCRPKTMILENVMGLRRGGQDLAVRDRLSVAGYASVIIATTPLTSGFPQDRPRLFFLAIRRDVLACAGITDVCFEEYARGLVSALADNHPAVDFNSCLLPEHDPFVMRMKISELDEIDRRGRLPLTRPRSNHCGKWVEKHKHLAANCCRSNWDDALTEAYPAFRLLPDRVKDLLDIHSCAFPDRRVGAWNVSQTQAILGKGHCTCITPKALFWLPHRGRRMYGREAMTLQGMYMKDWDSVADIADDKLLMELAGNAFCTISVLPLQMALLTILARSLGGRCGLPRNPTASSSESGGAAHKRTATPSAEAERCVESKRRRIVRKRPATCSD